MNQWTAIRSEGGLFTEDTIGKILQGEYGGQKPADFGLDGRRRLEDEVAVAWSGAQKLWAAYDWSKDHRKGSSSTTLTREQWLVPFLEGILGYELTYQRTPAEVGGTRFPISHRAGPDESAPPVHLEAHDIDLDRRHPDRQRRRSPQALMQDYLNRSEHLWGVLTNGERLRLIRQNPRISRPAYLEFDLRAIFGAGKFDEFAILYRLCHRTRLPRSVEDASDCWLERYFQESILEGGRVRDKLRDGVETALKVLGQGFLTHRANRPLQDALRTGKLKPSRYYQELLRLVYRLLFLMVAEERRMLVPRGLERQERIYRELYSVERLRQLADRPVKKSLHSDLWLGLQATFRMLGQAVEGENPLGIPPLNGDLFGPEAIPHLEGTRLYNHDLLRAIRSLAMFRDGGAMRRVNFAALDVEELGSVYESLLDYAPVVRESGDGLVFDLVPGTERKSTGSYYTRPELVKELIESALVPVMEERLRAAGSHAADREAAILGMRVCDPACGSGHFLLEAARRMGRELARVRTGEEEPTPEDFREAVRDVIEHCIYGVDVNPLAVDLCKLALWIEGHNVGRPLSFLDHRIRCGNSLVGIATLGVLRHGIPDEAYTPLTGDDRKVAGQLKKRNRQERQLIDSGQRHLLHEIDKARAATLAEAHTDLGRMPQVTAEQVRTVAERFRAIRAEGTEWERLTTAADLWTAAFFAPKTPDRAELVPTSMDVATWMEGRPLVEGSKVRQARELARRYRFFHWPFEFPEVFAAGGFDVVLGNPPWERVKLQEEEFFRTRDPYVASAPNKAERERRITELKTRNPALWRAFVGAKSAAEAESLFARCSGRFDLTGVGDINTYALFAELGWQLLGERGRVGMVLPTGIATDYTYRHFFERVVQRRALATLYDFENRERLFPDVDSRQKFCLLTLTKRAVGRPRFAFFCTRAEHLLDERRVFTLDPSDLLLVNPNTGTCPVFRTRIDAELTAKIYRRVPVLVNERTGENPWGVRFLTMFHMANDSRLFHFEPGSGRLPLYEAKMFHQFDHRWATYEDGRARDVRHDEKEDPAYVVTPRYWVDRSAVLERIPSDWRHEWFIVFRDVARATDARTVIAAVIPAVGVGNTAPLILCNAHQLHIAALLANLNTFCLDYVARQKIGGTHLTFFLLQQLPVLSPDSYSSIDLNFIVPRVLELTYTSHNLKDFARDMGYEGPTFSLNEQRRALLRAELDAYYALLYGVTREELLYILDPQEIYGDDFPGETFRVLKENEIRRYGEYRTKRLVLEAYDRLAPSFRQRH